MLIEPVVYSSSTALSVATPIDMDPIQDGPLQAYRALRREGKLQHDAAQELAAEKLQSLYNALKDFQPGGRQSWAERLGLARFLAADSGAESHGAALQGLYLYGGVGRGKSMLMDLFFVQAPTEKKRRVHFHAFMQEVHETLHKWRSERPRELDLIPALAEKLAAESWLICFDEFHVGNIADAMILGRLFGALFDLGVIVVATSNWAPDDLYPGGLQRDQFLPFIALLKSRLDVLELADGRDWRLSRLKDMAVYHSPLGPASRANMAAAFSRLTDGADPKPSSLVVLGRSLAIARGHGRIAWFDFSELCEQPLGVSDYLAIATHFDVVLIDEMPRLDADRSNEARRFMILIDVLYEHRVTAIIAAAARPEQLFTEGEGDIEFQRTVSRLNEMQSADYLARPHLT
jgi:cell division protein ZapE